jgi:dCMP deaminase
MEMDRSLSQQRKDDYYLDIAEAVARKSTCCRRAYGAIIVNEDEVIATGYNGSPRGCINCTEMGCMREILGINKGDAYNLCTSVHAEQNALISASRKEMIGGTIYIVGLNRKPQLVLEQGIYADPSPCLLCHRMICNAGLVRAVGAICEPNDGTRRSCKDLDISGVNFMERVQKEYEKTIAAIEADPHATQEDLAKACHAKELIFARNNWF